MRVCARVLAVLSCIVLAAHFLRAGILAGVVVALALPFLMLVRAAWGTALLRVALAFATLEWVRTALAIYRVRQVEGSPAGKALAIFAAVALATALSAFLLRPRLTDTRSERS